MSVRFATKKRELIKVRYTPCAASLAECDRCTDRLLLDIEAIREKTKYVFHAY
jgi:hypothetical protein